MTQQVNLCLCTGQGLACIGSHIAIYNIAFKGNDCRDSAAGCMQLDLVSWETRRAYGADAQIERRITGVTGT